ncbi:MAG: NAD(P)/FAD-dependent oxidoreductase [Pseudomonadota bacterium]
MQNETDRVIVVGAGPVGMVAAVSLLQDGIPVTILEATPDLPDDLRASTFHPPTLDFLDRFGISERLVAIGLKCPHWQFRDRQEGVIATFDLGLLKDDTDYPYRLQCEQWKLTRMLREMVDGHADGTLITNFEAQEVSQDANAVAVSGVRPDGTQETVRGRYLIAADGAKSPIRKQLGVNFEGMTIPEVFLSLSTEFRFDKAIPELSNIAYISDPKEWFVLLRTPTLWRVLFPTDPQLTDEEMLAPEAMEPRLQAIAETPEPYAVVHKTAYRVHERVADRYVHGRVFLAGDAAHLNNPLGGMGMNGGIHDAMNLTEKLKDVWKGASADILQRYERQRRKVALETVQAQALRNRKILNETDPASRRDYHDSLRATVDDPKAHKAYVLRSSMIQSLRDLESVA